MRVILASILLLSGIGLAHAEKGNAKEKGPRGHRPDKAEFMKRFDTDKDGEISADEKKAVKEHHQEMKKKHFDKDKDGTLSAEEQTAFDEAVARRQAHRKAALAEFDTDGDGELNKAERKAAHAARMKDGRGRKGSKKGRGKAEGSAAGVKGAVSE